MPLAKHDFHDEQLKKGLGALAAAGVAVEPPNAVAIPQLRQLWRKSPETDMAAAFLLGKIPTIEAAQLLREFDQGLPDKDLQKEIKRSLFKLTQKGIAVPQEPAPETKAAPLFERETQIEAYMSAVDGGGGRLIWIAKPQPNRGLQVIEEMVHDSEKILSFSGVQMKRKELRAMADDIKQQHGVSMIAIT